jgi:competence protein ComEA
LADSVQGAVDINAASAQELETLWRVGPTLAKRIVDYRQQHGAFRRPEDLLQVRGIGPTILQRNLARIQVSPPSGP